MRHLTNLGLALLMLAMLAGCGQKGPLYLPGDEEAAATYDPGNEYADEQADDDGDEDQDAQDGNDDDAGTPPPASDGEG
ncbi:Predicted small lipoprotein YifL [Modicisalibacter muralis]|uniref:Predicted small lipoprotein YifL n=1 Tax=Modicisalibacter muralis TaxID=119000 RepID=A0A1G9NL46_9GAMM|nr:lipoprotein [Halomonas muralis]SDL87071.1 Predicted small lipoprotein YifL [Halomonas muralis]